MIIIPALLEKGDVFLMENVTYIVTAVDEDKVRFTATTSKNGVKGLRLGIHSKKKIVLIEDCDYGDFRNLGKDFVIKPSL